MKKLFKNIMYASVLILAFSGSAFAQPPQEEINQLLAELGWDIEDLTSYLAYYELSLADFETVEELRMALGTPITPENLNELLITHDMSREDLDTLLAGFGESVEEDYVFIEDLEIAIDFYRNHDSLMKEFENFLTAIGVTEEEADNLFNHFMALDQLNLESQMEEVGARLESLMMSVDPEAGITDAQKMELVSIWDQIMGSAQLNPRFFLVNGAGNRTPISFGDLANMENLPSDALLVELFNTQGIEILDLQVSAEMLGSEFAINAGEKMTDIADLAGELTELNHQKLPDTASPYITNMLIGIVAVMGGIGMLFYNKRRRVTRKV
ncbi:MAG TPA: processed acidic surface protein [Bacillus sp. (in: firmicutes)]|uniref:processed acidic surface protein n=1 Tax=Bacillus litorisediminis TaxID=2922713 RepID=UPI001FAFBE01|nr:processed acidic surface protein [Bacillus litorisediminis]HWO75279.1 processed acidic surface protein [Bacillus sp. (in: firmicutes)]